MDSSDALSCSRCRERQLNNVVGTLAVEGWAVSFGTARRELGGAANCDQT